MNSTLAALYASVDISAILAAALIIVGIAASGIRFISKRSTRRSSSRALFPAVKASSVILQGPEKCSLDGNLFMPSKHLVNGDFVYDFSADYGLCQYQNQYQSQGQIQSQIPHVQAQPSHSQSQSQSQSQIQPSHNPNHPSHHQIPYPFEYQHPQAHQQYHPQLSVAPPASHAPHAPKRRSAQPLEHHHYTPYYHPKKQVQVQKPANGVQIFSPTMSSSDQRFLDYAPQPLEPLADDGLAQWPHPQAPSVDYNYPLLIHSQPGQAELVDQVPTLSTYSAPAPPAAPQAAPQAAPLITQPETEHPLFDDVVDVVYGTDFSFAAVQSNAESLSHTSSDHSDQELWFSPPSGGQQQLSCSPEGDESASGSPGQHDRFVCPHCGAGFRVKGYLTRHLKKHARQKAYTCPFYSPERGHKCHPTGGFSRRDTYKTHLKARHFVYPPNTPCNKRAQAGGTCSGCQQTFTSNETWVESHIQTKECPILSM